MVGVEAELLTSLEYFCHNLDVTKVEPDKITAAPPATPFVTDRSPSGSGLVFPPKKIPLTQGQFALVDADDFEKFGDVKWCAMRDRGGNFYAVRAIGQKAGEKKIMLRLHREIMRAPSGTLIDHINHNTLDNRKSNLRPCTHSQNAMNQRGANRDNRSGHRGICRNSTGKKWQVAVKHNGKSIHIGYFSNKQDAIDAYAEANKKYYGEFGGSF